MFDSTTDDKDRGVYVKLQYMKLGVKCDIEITRGLQRR